MRKSINLFFVSILVLVVVLSPIITVSAQQDSDNDGISDSKEEQLALMYEPVLHFAAGEKFFPSDVSYHIDNSELYMKIGESNTLVDSSPTLSSISQYTTGEYFLNNTMGSYNEIVQDYKQDRASYGDKIYARVTKEAQYIAVQYWFFYAYNPGTLNQHQGDWEMIEIILDSTETPLYAVYSQHNAGELAAWTDVETVDETHPRVYVALGSHASYFRYYQGKIGTESDTLGNDYTLNPEDLEVVVLGEKGAENHPTSQDWLDFGGRWGNWANMLDEFRGLAGPSGPGEGENAEKWFTPVAWGTNKFVVDQTWFTASLIAYYFIYIFAIIIGAIAVYKIWIILKLKKAGNLNIIRILRSKAAWGVILGLVGTLVYLIALFLPWYIVTGDIQTTVIDTAGTTELVLIDGVNGVRVNTLQNDQGLATVLGIGIPFSIIFLSSVVLNFLDVIGAEKTKKLSRKYIISGITSVIPIVVIIIFIVTLTGLISTFAGSFSGGQPIPQLNDMVSAMSSSPISGSYTDTINSSGTIDVSWGLAVGSYLFIFAAAIKIVAGIILRKERIPDNESVKDELTK